MYVTRVYVHVRVTRRGQGLPTTPHITRTTPMYARVLSPKYSTLDETSQKADARDAGINQAKPVS